MEREHYLDTDGYWNCHACGQSLYQSRCSCKHRYGDEVGCVIHGSPEKPVVLIDGEPFEHASPETLTRLGDEAWRNR